MLVPVAIPKLDPLMGITTPTRPVEGILYAETVVLDQDFSQFGRWILCGTAGTLSYQTMNDITVTLPLINAGVFHPIWAKRVNSSGTSATDLVWGN